MRGQDRRSRVLFPRSIALQRSRRLQDRFPAVMCGIGIFCLDAVNKIPRFLVGEYRRSGCDKTRINDNDFSFREFFRNRVAHISSGLKWTAAVRPRRRSTVFRAGGFRKLLQSPMPAGPLPSAGSILRNFRSAPGDAFCRR